MGVQLQRKAEKTAYWEVSWLAVSLVDVKVKWSRYRPCVAQKVRRGIALLFHDRGTRRGWVVSSTPQPHFTPGKDPVPILQEAGWASGPVWTGEKSRPHRDSIPDRPVRSQSLYRLSYRANLHQMLVWSNQERREGHVADMGEWLMGTKVCRKTWRDEHIWNTWV